MGVDYLAFRQSYRNSLMHSPKGTTWKNHKYIKIVDGRYIYDKDAHEQDIKDAGKEIYNQIKENRNKSTDFLSRSNSELGKAIENARNRNFHYDVRTEEMAQRANLEYVADRADKERPYKTALEVGTKMMNNILKKSSVRYYPINQSGDAIRNSLNTYVNGKKVGKTKHF